jgi:hypothetical protein
MLLTFDKPAKVTIDAGFDGGPVGGYVPQMSQSDAQRWKAKHFNLGKENARIELRKTFTGIKNGQGSSQVFMIVALDGWDLAAKHEHRRAFVRGDDEYFHNDTRGLNVRMSMNGPLLMSFEQFAEINQIVQEAHEYLKAHISQE